MLCVFASGAAGLLYELFQLPDLAEVFYAVTIRRTFPNPLLRDVLEPEAQAAGLAAGEGGQ